MSLKIVVHGKRRPAKADEEWLQQSSDKNKKSLQSLRYLNPVTGRLDMEFSPGKDAFLSNMAPFLTEIKSRLSEVSWKRVKLDFYRVSPKTTSKFSISNFVMFPDNCRGEKLRWNISGLVLTAFERIEDRFISLTVCAPYGFSFRNSDSDLCTLIQNAGSSEVTLKVSFNDAFCSTDVMTYLLNVCNQTSKVKHVIVDMKQHKYYNDSLEHLQNLEPCTHVESLLISTQARYVPLITSSFPCLKRLVLTNLQTANITLDLMHMTDLEDLVLVGNFKVSSPKNLLYVQILTVLSQQLSRSVRRTSGGVYLYFPLKGPEVLSLLRSEYGAIGWTGWQFKNYLWGNTTYVKLDSSF